VDRLRLTEVPWRPDQLLFEQLNSGHHRTYLIADEESREAMLIDPVYEQVESYIARLHALGLRVTLAVDTHTHADHISGCRQLAKQMRCEYIMHELARAKCINRRVTHGDILTLGELPIDVIHTPGHSADGMTLIVEGRLMVGDVLFIGGAGRSDLPGGDPDEHWHTLHRTFQSFPDNTLFFPAHDYRGRDFSSLGHERRNNPHFEHKDRYSYVRWQEDQQAPTPAWVNKVLEANFLCEPLAAPERVPDDVDACQPWGGMPHLAEGGGMPKEIGVITLHERFDRGKLPILMLDVREEDEFKGHLGHIEGAYHLPLDQMDDRMEELDPFKHSEIVTICRSGGRSMTAAILLRSLGFEDVKSLRGGMIAWNSRGYRTNR
jgi:glyoxylase-like metal-dependent hydrolase (beta-lactamase superfamily II)/rhodanese-related sulfurtransferase